MQPFAISNDNLKKYKKLFSKLSGREIEVLLISKSGLTRHEIATVLNIHVSTVDNYFNQAMHKYEYSSIEQLRAFFNFTILEFLMTKNNID